MGETERDTTRKDSLGRESEKELLSESHESSQQKIPSEDTRGDALMAETAVKKRVSKKQSSETKLKDSSAESSSQVSPRPIFVEALFIREFQRMSGEIKRLREENEVFKAKEEIRRQQVKDAQARLRNKDPEAYRKYERERKRRRRAELKRQAQSSDQ